MKKNKKITLSDGVSILIGCGITEDVPRKRQKHKTRVRELSTFLRLVTLSALLGSTTSYGLQPNVDAGALLRQSEQEIKTQSPLSTFKTSPSKPTAKTAGDEASVFIRDFKFSGNSLINDEVLAKAVAPYVNRSLTMAQLREVADAVMGRYREAGWTVRAYLPRQEIAAGNVTIQVVEAVFGEASLTGEHPKRLSSARLLSIVQDNLQKGKPVNTDKLDRTLLLLDDLPGVTVSGNLVQGEHDGETNLALVANDEPLLTGNAVIDNQGARSTGADRLSANVSINSPLQLGDLIGINALKTQGSDYQRISYSMPVGYQGWRAGLHASNLNYKVITSDFASLNASGSATTSGLDFSYPLIRAQTNNLNLSLSYDNKKFDNSSSGSSTSYAIRVYNAQVNASLIDNWAGGGTTNLGFGVTAGEKLGDTRYTKLNLNLSRLQGLTEGLSFFTAVGSQVTNKNLDSSEKLYLGGASGVRAYPASEAGGADGSTLTLELRDRLRHDLTLTGFYDYGRVKVNHDNNIASPAIVNSYDLQGYGVTVAWQAKKELELKGTVAQRIGSNPAANPATGMDGDGTKKTTRVWVSASIAF